MSSMSHLTGFAALQPTSPCADGAAGHPASHATPVAPPAGSCGALQWQDGEPRADLAAAAAGGERLDEDDGRLDDTVLARGATAFHHHRVLGLDADQSGRAAHDRAAPVCGPTVHECDGRMQMQAAADRRASRRTGSIADVETEPRRARQLDATDE